jgi:uncharacterized caspase-like protein
MADITFVVAIETYADPKIAPVKFAEADAKEFSKALERHGFIVDALLLSGEATKTRVESAIRKVLESVTEKDRVFLYYAGHGFASVDRNYVTCHDTVRGDLEATSIPIQWIFSRIDRSECRRCAVFLDACHSGITHISNERGILDHLTEHQIAKFFADAEHKVCFSACKDTQKSYSAPALKHGIWTYHILEALNGDAPEALDQGRYLTAQSLQDYLQIEVPASARKVRSDQPKQTPVLYGSQTSNFRIVDLKELLAQRSAVDPTLSDVKEVIVRYEQQISVRNLGGFKRGHHVPDYVSTSTRQFVERAAQPDVEETLNTTFEAIKEKLNYKRKEMAIEAGKIVTPDFEYTVYASQDENEPTEALLIEEISNIEAKIIENEEFNEIFQARFDELVVSAARKINVTKVIDTVEALPSGIYVDFPKDCSSCEITFDNSRLSLVVHPNRVIVRAVMKSTPLELAKGLVEVKKLIAPTPVRKLLQ